jgi:hypothetical protein
MTTGYYSLIQYCPDPVRVEVVNVGVVLFCPAAGYLDLKLAPSAQRVRRAFGRGAVDAAEYAAARAAVERQVRAAHDRWREVTDLAHFAAIQGNAIRLTPPRQRLVREPVSELYQLFDRLVGAAPQRKRADVGEVLDREFAAPVYEGIIQSNVEVVVPAIRRAVTIPYGYQNGRFNLLRPVRFKSDGGAQGLLNTVGGITLEGRELYEHPSGQYGPLQLVVVAQFPHDDDMVRSVADRLRENHVRLYQFDEVNRLFDEIRRTAKPLNRAGTGLPVPQG